MPVIEEFSYSNSSQQLALDKPLFSIEEKFAVFEGSLNNEIGVEWAANIIEQGGVQAIQVGGVIGLFANAADRSAIEKILEMKGEAGKKKAFTMIMHASDAREFADLDKVEPNLLPILEKAEDRIGGIAHIRVPISESMLASDDNSRNEKIPSSAYSEVPDQISGEMLYEIQFLDPNGHGPLTRLIDELKKIGIKFVAATSMNEAGEKEIIDMEEAKKFCEKHKIRLLLKDDVPKRDDSIGSYSIVGIRKNGTGRAQLVRHGDMDEMLDLVLGKELDRENAISSHHSSHDYSPLKHYLGQQHLSPEQNRFFALEYKSGKSLDEIREEVEELKQNSE